MVDVINLKPTTEDDIISQAPEFVREQYPRFIQFLKAYYEWMEREDNPYHSIRHHLDYVNFQESLDSYVNILKKEYLSNIPSEMIGNDQLFIEWSKKLNLSRGSRESYLFLFQMMFGESSTDIFLPKDKILRTSDGNWISNQYKILISNPGDPDRLLHRKMVQTRVTSSDEIEVTEAIVDSYYTITYDVGFNLVQLTLTNVKGEFRDGYEVEVTEADGNVIKCWPVTTISDFVIEDGGKNFSVNDELKFNSSWSPTYKKHLKVKNPGILDTQITTVLHKNQLKITLDNYTLLPEDFEYDGQFIKSSLFNIDDDVDIELLTLPYYGKMMVYATKDQGSILNIKVSDTPIVVGDEDALIRLESDISYIVTPEVYAKIGIVREEPGYYLSDYGQLSSSMRLQDGEYYQEYSYVIKTEQDITKYAEVVKNVLHPSGFKMFGNLTIIQFIRLAVGLDQHNHWINVLPPFILALSSALYGAGGNYSFIWKTNGSFMSPRVYKGDEWDSSFTNPSSTYALQDKLREREFDENGDPIIVNVKGYMTRVGWSDADVRQPEDYFEHNNYNFLYMESSYVNTQEMDTQDFKDKYIEIYVTHDYIENEYYE